MKVTSSPTKKKISRIISSLAKYNGAIGVLLQDETLISATNENMVHNKYVSIQYQRP